MRAEQFAYIVKARGAVKTILKRIRKKSDNVDVELEFEFDLRAAPLRFTSNGNTKSKYL